MTLWEEVIAGVVTTFLALLWFVLAYCWMFYFVGVGELPATGAAIVFALATKDGTR